MLHADPCVRLLLQFINIMNVVFLRVCPTEKDFVKNKQINNDNQIAITL